ncbi:hypothetical protein VTN00DRAFT_8225 [Thermoascus crustaceus]|uniref:uncharacterized protein n=1 Tax=Thermoascus crustaceus TaxID=5088 RepID=UPI003742172F
MRIFYAVRNVEWIWIIGDAGIWAMERPGARDAGSVLGDERNQSQGLRRTQPATKTRVKGASAGRRLSGRPPADVGTSRRHDAVVDAWQRQWNTGCLGQKSLSRDGEQVRSGQRCDADASRAVHGYGEVTASLKKSRHTARAVERSAIKMYHGPDLEKIRVEVPDRPSLASPATPARRRLHVAKAKSCDVQCGLAIRSSKPPFSVSAGCGPLAPARRETPQNQNRK